jgi:anti-sigma regulatory factor (Ser/Thr protein kinase)
MMKEVAPAPQPATMVLAETTQLQIPSNLDWIEPTVDYLKTRALLCGAVVGAQAGRLVLALHEALTNSVVHGNLEVPSSLKQEGGDRFAQRLAERAADPSYASRLVHIGIDYDGQRCRWSLTDEGPGFDYRPLLDRPEPSPEDLYALSGRGILLMRAMMDEVRYEAEGRRAVLTLKRPGPERRQHPRLPMQQRVQVAPIRLDGSVDWEAAYDAVGHDLSPGGLGLIQKQLHQAERVLIGLEIEGQPVYLPAQVRHCQTVPDDLLWLGCRFVLREPAQAGPGQANLEEAIGALLAELQDNPVPADERRAHPRVRYTQRVEVIAPTGGSLVGYARDISRGGVSFITAEALPREERLLVLPASTHPPARVKVQVVRCNEITEGFYDVAVRFLDLA